MKDEQQQKWRYESDKDKPEIRKKRDQFSTAGQKAPNIRREPANRADAQQRKVVILPALEPPEQFEQQDADAYQGERRINANCNNIFQQHHLPETKCNR